MAELDSLEVLSRRRPTRLSAVPAAHKLRDSCHACATSKVKCSKLKPTCARCTRRGLKCEYFAAKRPGRNKQAIESSNTTNVTQTLPGVSWSTTSATRSSTSTSPNLSQPSPGQHTSGYSNVLLDLFPPADSTSSIFTTLSTDVDNFFASPISFPWLEMSDPETLAQSLPFSKDVNNGLLDSNGVSALLIPEDAFPVDDAESAFPVDDAAVCKLLEPSKQGSPPNNRASTNNNGQSFQGLLSESSCGCLIRALSLLKQQFPNASTDCTPSRGPGYEDTTYQLPTIQSIVAENERTIEAISNMLQCPCSQDGYLLAIMSIIVFKVLGWYAAAARETPVKDDSQSSSKCLPDHRRRSPYHYEQVLQSPAVVGSYCINGEEQGRMAAQLVLSELHRVQRLVNLLSQRLKGQGVRNGAVGTPNSVADGQNLFSDGENTCPFSGAMLDQLEADLRKRLRALSLEIIDRLRQE